MLASTKVPVTPPVGCIDTNSENVGIGPKVSQSVLTAAFLFAFKDVLYEQTIKLRRKLPVKA